MVGLCLGLLQLGRILWAVVSTCFRPTTLIEIETLVLVVNMTIGGHRWLI